MRHRGYSAVSAQAWLLVAAVSIAACSPSTSQEPAAGSHSAPTASAGASIAGATRSVPPSTDHNADTIVGEEDAGKRVLLRPGQRLGVVLGADFRPVDVSDDRVLDPVAASGGYPTGQPLMTVLTAVAPGEVSLTSSTDFSCLHEPTPCSVPQREWTLSVTVAAG